MKIKDFATKIKESYPEYKSMDNVTLVNKVLESYPEYKSQVDNGGEYVPPAINQDIPKAEASGFMGKLGEALAPRSMQQEIDKANAPAPLSGTGLPLTGEGVLPADQVANVLAANQNPIAFKKTAGNIASDALSLPGRAVASTPEAINVPKAVLNPQQYAQDIGESMSKTQSDKTGVSGFVGDVVRSPATGAAALTGGLGAGLVPTAAAGAGATQLENIGQGKEASLPQAGLETVLGVVTGGLGQKLGPVLGAKAQKMLNRPIKEIDDGLELLNTQLNNATSELNKVKRTGNLPGKKMPEVEQVYTDLINEIKQDIHNHVSEMATNLKQGTKQDLVDKLNRLEKFSRQMGGSFGGVGVITAKGIKTSLDKLGKAGKWVATKLEQNAGVPAANGIENQINSPDESN